MLGRGVQSRCSRWEGLLRKCARLREVPSVAVLVVERAGPEITMSLAGGGNGSSDEKQVKVDCSSSGMRGDGQGSSRQN